MTNRKRPASPGEKPGKKPGPRMVPQPHGGAIWVNGNPNPTPGPGRPPSALRERMRGALDERLHVAEDIADNTGARDADRIAALHFLVRYGLPAQLELETVTDPVAWGERARAELLDEVRRLGPEGFAGRLKELLDGAED